MDAFEKLAGLVGASAEATPGYGLPRTHAEAKVLGMTHYYTGKPCKRGHVADRYAVTRQCVECKRQYGATPEVREYKRLNSASPKTRARMRQLAAAPEFRERKRQRNMMAKTGDAALYAINQAERAAVSARAAADIVPQCPEPQRSQLQALVDRIKADPQAGKAVVGLLRTMRELRKAELAEMRRAEADPV